MTDEQIVELMARATCCEGGVCQAGNGHPCLLATCEGIAKSALTALRSAGMAVVPREPTEAMYAAVCDPQAVFKHTKPDERGGKIPLLPAVHYRAMINTAEGKTE